MSRRHFGEFEQLLLYTVLHLQHEEEDANGPAIRATIEARTGRVISPGAIYTALNRLESRGFVRSALGDPTPERGGKRKRTYQLRPAGETALKAAHAGLEQMARLARLKR